MECRIAKPRSAALRGLALLIRVDANEITYLRPIALRLNSMRVITCTSICRRARQYTIRFINIVQKVDREL